MNILMSISAEILSVLHEVKDTNRYLRDTLQKD